jgi:hypothetical protein
MTRHPPCPCALLWFRHSFSAKSLWIQMPASRLQRFVMTCHCILVMLTGYGAITVVHALLILRGNFVGIQRSTD